jgi:hypothetical protein
VRKIKSDVGGKSRKRVKFVKLMPIIYIKGNCYETPLYGHVLGDKRTVIRTRYEKWEEPTRVGWGRGRGGEKGKGTVCHNHL